MSIYHLAWIVPLSMLIGAVLGVFAGVILAAEGEFRREMREAEKDYG